MPRAYHGMQAQALVARRVPGPGGVAAICGPNLPPIAPNLKRQERFSKQAKPSAPELQELLKPDSCLASCSVALHCCPPDFKHLLGSLRNGQHGRGAYSSARSLVPIVPGVDAVARVVLHWVVDGAQRKLLRSVWPHALIGPDLPLPLQRGKRGAPCREVTGNWE